MSMTFVKETETLYVVSVSGVLAYGDLKEAEKSSIGTSDRSQKVNILVLADQFSGWGKEGDWGDLTFMYEHDPYIDKIAVVAEDKWRDEILMFLGAGRRQASVEFFLSDEIEDARDWLQDDSI